MFNFNLPIIDRPILWYGFFFALGFFVGYLILIQILRRNFGPDQLKKISPDKLAEQMVFYVICGGVIGSRLGDVLFYQNWADLLQRPLSIIAIWEGGLASHGGALGILIALGLFAKKRKIPFWTAVDFTVIPAAIAAVFIRIGNFFNQEILGVPTSKSWGVLFLHPADGGPIVPRHPAQLYEAVAYLLIFGALFLFWRKRTPFAEKGKLTGLFLVLAFSARFLIEFLKMEQSAHLSENAVLTMGQWLSLPFIGLGIGLLFKAKGQRLLVFFRKE